MSIGLNNLLKRIEQLPDINPQSIDLFKRAYEFAYVAHQGQKRSSGEPYFDHCLATAQTLIDMKLDTDTIIAGLLHDVAEDTKYTLQDIAKNFGEEIAFLVEGVTKLGKIKYRGDQRKVENLRKMFLAMAKDVRVVLIKLADRLHNMNTLQSVPPEKQQRIALETLEIYAPLAHRLGMGEIKGQLEDLAFYYLHPKEYKWLIDNLSEEYQTRENYIDKIAPVIKQELNKENINPLRIDTRVKHYYSLYKKLLKCDMNFEKIHDLVAVRIVVNTIEECYGVLGVIHKLWRPLPGKIKDYIALPKPNGYQSLHTTVFCLDGKITEFQIRTAKMHDEAEFGITAHWLYTEKGKPKTGAKLDEKKFSWVSQLRDWQHEISGSQEFLESLKIDFFKDRIFCLTPKGDAIDLPEGATPIDFAYHIHSDVGDHCSGAKVNGKMTPLSHALQNGDVVEILTQKKHVPSRAWLEFTKTSIAKNRIRHSLKKEQGIEIIATKKSSGYHIEVKVICVDRIGLMKDISEEIQKLKINIESINSIKEHKSSPMIINITSTIKKRSTVEQLIAKLKQVKNVIGVTYKISSRD